MNDTPYFSHNANTLDDPKIISLTDDLGLTGYGAFWMLLEVLRVAPEYKASIRILNRLERTYGLDKGTLNKIVTSYDLFVVEEEIFYSKSLLERMKVVDEKKEKCRNSAKIGAKKRANAKQTFSDRSANICNRSANKIKGNKIKELNIVGSNEPTCDSTLISKPDLFVECWELYGKVGTRKPAEQKFNKLSQKDQEMIKAIIPAYVQQTPDKQYRKHFVTFLNQRAWEDVQVIQQSDSTNNIEKPLPDGVSLTKDNKVFLCGNELPKTAYPIPAKAKRWDYSTNTWIV